jgi:hypothetical protein
MPIRRSAVLAPVFTVFTTITLLVFTTCNLQPEKSTHV